MMTTMCLSIAVLPWTLIEGGMSKGGWAGSTSPGSENPYGEVFQGGPDLGIQYYFNSTFSRICCQAIGCEYKQGCYFVDVGCGQSKNGVPFPTTQLHWEVRGVEPVVRCNNSRGVGAYYIFHARVFPMET
ncbi:insoluble matrix shell protein 3-like [Mercenaria mercenaria]|uniref:insoluble matrix shell protein 3-like n=1 Tax=Mercenaria mercenaria TaxID=6596 RepID=UPI00234E4EF1|nr:insoluble matrix shell protein 3-like [Mercenaria mercenaria]